MINFNFMFKRFDIGFCALIVIIFIMLIEVIVAYRIY